MKHRTGLSFLRSENPLITGLFILCLSLLLTACASTAPSEERSGEVYYRHAGHEVGLLSYTAVRGWRPVGDSAVMLELDRRRYVLAELDPSCINEARFASQLGLVSRTPGTLSRFDSLRIDRRQCRIESLRVVDFDAVREDLRALRAAPEPTRNQVELESSGGT